MKMFDLSGKAAIVTGGNGGIGLGMARGLALAGASVAVVGRNADKSAKAAKELEALGTQAGGNGKFMSVQADVTNSEDVARMVADVAAEFGRVDILVNNAGTNIRKAPQDLSEEEWHLVMDTNLTSAFLCSKACYAEFKKVGGGKVLNNGSMMSIFGGPFHSVYAATKGGMVQMTKSLACSWAQDNIQVNCFLPGWIDTELTQKARKDITGLQDSVLKRTPAGRWGHIDDFQGLAVYLASSASDFLTGTAIPLDGGYSVMGV